MNNNIRDLCHYTWHPFFAKFPKLREIQIICIPEIIKGKNLLAYAPTASGKTEALLAPLIERLYIVHKANIPRKTLILIVAPTRALCNDLFRRLQKPINSCFLDINIKSSDSPTYNEKKPPHILITTPESLDSILTRRPILLSEINAVFIDEIHLLSQSPRGDQLQCLLQRLKSLSITQIPIQICAASATISDADNILKNFFNAPTFIAKPQFSPKKINYKTIICTTLQQCANAIANLLQENKQRKLLVFANARAQVENIVLELNKVPQLSSKIFAHHGSLSKSERLKTEHNFFLAQNAACIATSTLELGIDIGNVDYAVLMGPPPDVSALLQRIGRANRKSQSSNLLCICRDNFDELRFEHLLNCAQNNLLLNETIPFRPSVIPQQALSLAFQNPNKWISPINLHKRLAPAAQKLFTQQDCYEILQNIEQAQLLRQIDNKKFIPEPKAIQLHKHGLIHSMIDDNPQLDVVDAMTGRHIGSVALSQKSKNALANGLRPTLSLAGRGHQIAFMKEQKIYVNTAGATKSANFVATEKPRYSLELAQSFAQNLGLPQDSFQVICLAHDHFQIQHFLGTIGSILFSALLSKYDISVLPRSATPFYITISQPPPINKLPEPETLKPILEMILNEHITELSKTIQSQQYLKYLPEKITIQWVKTAIPIEKYTQLIANKNFLLIESNNTDKE